MTPRRAVARDDGLLATELAMLMPVMVLVALVAVFVVQVQRHGSQAQAAADSAARAASWATSREVAQELASAAGQRVCFDSTTTVSEWTPPQLGALRPGRVVVDVVCRQSYGGFSSLGVGSDRAATATGVSSIEYWRET